MDIRKPAEFVRAYGQEALSWPIHHLPVVLENILMKPPEIGSHHNLQWFKARDALSDYFTWAMFDPTSKSKTFASQFEESGLIGVNRDAIERHRDLTGGCLAVGYALPYYYVMYGEVPPDVELGSSPEYPDMLLMGMGIGRRNPLRASVGLCDPDTKIFIIPPGAHPQPLYRYENNEFPTDIPHF